MDQARPQPQDDYVDKLPSPPRVVVPPPVPTIETKLKSTPIKTRMNSVFEGAEIDPSFLRAGWGNWGYIERQQAQRIIPCLLLGSFAAARDPQFLQNEAITMVVAVVFTRPTQTPMTPAVVKAAQEQALATHVVTTFSNQDLIARFPEAIDAINTHFRGQKYRTGNFGKVLVCCSSGNELSAAVVVAYLLETTELSLVPAVQLAQYQRFCINLDDAMRQTLQSYEDILIARRAVKSDPSAARPPMRQSIMCNIPATNNVFLRRGSKRALDDSSDTQLEIDGDAIMTNAVQGEHHARSFAPFSSR